jgi:CheY-like chemotaxis protein
MAKVLIVERDDAVREARRFVLADAGYDVMEAVNDRIALRMLSAARQPVVALFDLMALDASGRNALATIAADERLARRHAYAMLAPAPPATPSTLRPILAMLGAQVIHQPASAEDLLHAVALASERARVKNPPAAHARREQRTGTRRRPESALARGAIWAD